MLIGIFKNGTTAEFQSKDFFLLWNDDDVDAVIAENGEIFEKGVNR